MAHVAIDTSFLDSPAAVLLGERLGDPDAWRYLVRLWAHQIDAGNSRGVLQFPAWKIAEISKFPGNAELFVASLIESGLLKQKKGGEIYLAGWSRNKRYFSERKRLAQKQKRYRERRSHGRSVTGNVAGHVPGNGGGNVDGNVLRSPSPSLSPSPSPSLSEEKRGPATDQLDRADQVIQAVLDRLHLKWPGTAHELRISSCTPVRRAVVETAAEATLHADQPNWEYFVRCLERPLARRSGKPALKLSARELKESITAEAKRRWESDPDAGADAYDAIRQQVEQEMTR